jgi:hypothetical protein
MSTKQEITVRDRRHYNKLFQILKDRIKRLELKVKKIKKSIK